MALHSKCSLSSQGCSSSPSAPSSMCAGPSACARLEETSMDLGIAGRKALVCAASKGLGRGCAEALADAGVDVTIVARTRDDVRRTADEIGARVGRQVAWVACDITTADGRAAALAICPEPDILVNNAGGPPPG